MTANPIFSKEVVLMLNQRLINQLEPILNRLHTAISLLDIRGNSLIPASEIRYTLPALTEPGVPVRADGRIWQICASSRDLVLMSILQENEQIQDAFTLCDAMIGAVLRANAMSSDLNSTYQRLLENDLSLTEIDAVADELETYRITEQNRGYTYFTNLREGFDMDAWLSDIAEVRSGMNRLYNYRQLSYFRYGNSGGRISILQPETEQAAALSKEHSPHDKGPEWLGAPGRGLPDAVRIGEHREGWLVLWLRLRLLDRVHPVSQEDGRHGLPLRPTGRRGASGTTPGRVS